MRIRLAIPDRLVTPEALEAALEATSLANEQAVIRGEVPHAADAIRRGIKWQPEPFLDGEHFDLAHVVASRGWGDCDDLAPYLTGSLRASGEDPGARSRVYKTGPDRWHVVTETSDGEILDPSKWAGMGKKSAAVSGGIIGVIDRPFARMGEGALCTENTGHASIFRFPAALQVTSHRTHAALRPKHRSTGRWLALSHVATRSIVTCAIARASWERCC